MVRQRGTLLYRVQMAAALQPTPPAPEPARPRECDYCHGRGELLVLLEGELWLCQCGNWMSAAHAAEVLA